MGCSFFKQVFLDSIVSFKASTQSDRVVVLSSPNLTSPYPRCLSNSNCTNVDMIASGLISGVDLSILFGHLKATFFVVSAKVADNKGS